MAHDRFQVTDPICGLVETAMTRADALAIAQRHECRRVKVHDVMARRVAVRTWKRDGTAIEVRAVERVLVNADHEAIE